MNNKYLLILDEEDTLLGRPRGCPGDLRSETDPDGVLRLLMQIPDKEKVDEEMFKGIKDLCHIQNLR